MARASYSRLYDELYDFLITSGDEYNEDTLPTVEQIITFGESSRGTPVRNIPADRKRRAVERVYEALQSAPEYDDALTMHVAFIVLKA